MSLYIEKKILFTQGVDFTMHIFFLIISSYFWWDLFFRDITSHSHHLNVFIYWKKILFTQGVDFTMHIFFLIISSYFWWDLFFRDITSHSHPSQPFSSRGVLSCSGHYWPLHTDIVSGLCGYPLSSGPQLTYIAGEWIRYRVAFTIPTSTVLVSMYISLLPI